MLSDLHGVNFQDIIDVEGIQDSISKLLQRLAMNATHPIRGLTNTELVIVSPSHGAKEQTVALDRYLQLSLLIDP